MDYTPKSLALPAEPSREELVAYAGAAALKAGIDPLIFVTQIEVESNFDPRAESPAAAKGIAQIVERWHPGIDVWDPYASLDYAAKLMRSYLDEYGGDWTKALIRYNGGIGAVIEWQNGKPYDESVRYVRAILG